MDYTFENCGGHIEVRNSTGDFVFSADTINEAHKELREMEA